MAEKKIATAVEVLIKTAQFENIRVTKYHEAKIEFESDEEMRQKEDKLSEAAVDDLIRGLRIKAEKIGKRIEGVIEEAKENIQKRIPEWLEADPEPNIANLAQKAHEKAEAEIHADEENKKEEEKNDPVLAPEPVADNKEEKKEEKKEEPEQKKESESEAKKEAEESDDLNDDDLFMDDDDLFS